MLNCSDGNTLKQSCLRAVVFRSTRPELELYAPQLYSPAFNWQAFSLPLCMPANNLYTLAR